MNEQEITWRSTDLATSLARGRVSRVTLASLLHTHLAVSQRSARTSALAHIAQATAGANSAAREYALRVSISASTISPIMTFHLWLTQYATVHGFLLASGASPHDWSLSRKRMEEIRRTSEAAVLIDVDAFTTKVERSRQITRSVLGAGRYSSDTSLPTLSDVIYQLETQMINGFPATPSVGLLGGGLLPRGRKEKSLRGRSLPGWTQMTFDDLSGSDPA